jgi:hypothetical protein
MSAVPRVKRVVWRHDRTPRRSYVGYLALLDDAFRLAGREEQRGIDAALTLPHDAVCDVRTCACAPTDADGDIEIVLEFAEDVSIVLRPLAGGPAQTEALARRLRTAIRPPGGSVRL